MKAEFNDYAQDYRKNLDEDLFLTGGTSQFFAEYKAKKLKELLNPTLPKPKVILDFGCGDGLMTKEVAKIFPDATLYGVDPSEEIIELAKNICPKVNFMVSNSHLLEIFKNQKFDLIYSAMVFHHIPFNEHTHYIKQLVSLLNANGRLIIQELNPFNPMAQYIINTASIDVNAHMLMPWYTTKLLAPYGKISRKYTAFFPPVFSPLLKFEPYLTWLPLGAFSNTILEKHESRIR